MTHLRASLLVYFVATLLIFSGWLVIALLQSSITHPDRAALRAHCTLLVSTASFVVCTFLTVAAIAGTLAN